MPLRRLVVSSPRSNPTVVVRTSTMSSVMYVWKSRLQTPRSRTTAGILIPRQETPGNVGSDSSCLKLDVVGVASLGEATTCCAEARVRPRPSSEPSYSMQYLSVCCFEMYDCKLIYSLSPLRRAAASVGGCVSQSASASADGRFASLLTAPHPRLTMLY